MTPAKLQKILDKQSSVALKVYEAIPINEPWTMTEIVKEVMRSGTNTNLSIVQGCVNTLVREKAIKEPTRGHFIRQKTSGDKVPPPIKVVSDNAKGSEVMAEQKDVAGAEEDSMDLLSGIADRIRGVAKQMNAVATDIENAAVAIAERSGNNSDELKKLRALHEAMRALQG